MKELALAQSGTEKSEELARGLGLFDSTMFVVGAMIGSGIFIVPAEMARNVGSAAWLLVAWAVGGVLTIAGVSVLRRTLRHDATCGWHVSVPA